MTVRGGDVARLRVELEMAELEAGGYAYALAAPAGDPVARRREKLPHEAHVDFDGIEHDLDATVARITAAALRLRPVALDGLLIRSRSAGPVGAPLATTISAARLRGIAVVPGLHDAVTAATRTIAGELLDLHGRCRSRVHAELVASGMPAHRIRPKTVRPTYAPLLRRAALAAGEPPTPDGTVSTLTAQAARVATAPVTQLLDAAATVAAQHDGPGARPGDVAAAVVDAVAGLSDRGIADVASQAVNRAAGLGRSDGFDDVDLEDTPGAVEGEPPGGVGSGQVLIYASELIDRSTCYPCALVDGTEYDTEIAALEDYPFGQYASCLGGSRCRGMLVYVWSPEAPATIGLPR